MAWIGTRSRKRRDLPKASPDIGHCMAVLPSQVRMYERHCSAHTAEHGLSRLKPCHTSRRVWPEGPPYVPHYGKYVGRLRSLDRPDSRLNRHVKHDLKSGLSSTAEWFRSMYTLDEGILGLALC